MRYLRTQIYLDPEDHRRLVEEARERGVSLTALIREIVSSFTRERRPQRARGLESLIGFAGGDATNVAHEEKDYREVALEGRLQRKLGRKR